MFGVTAESNSTPHLNAGKPVLSPSLSKPADHPESSSCEWWYVFLVWRGNDPPYADIKLKPNQHNKSRASQSEAEWAGHVFAPSQQFKARALKNSCGIRTQSRSPSQLHPLTNPQWTPTHSSRVFLMDCMSHIKPDPVLIHMLTKRSCGCSDKHTKYSARMAS